MRCTGCGKMIMMMNVRELDYKFDSDHILNLGTFDDFIKKNRITTRLEEYSGGETKYYCETCVAIKDVIE